MDWWGIGLIVAAGVAVVVYGYVDDRRKTRERDAAMLAPPKRDIPRFQPMAEAPAYLSELQARTRPDQLASTDLNALTRTDLLAAQAAAPMPRRPAPCLVASAAISRRSRTQQRGRRHRRVVR